MLTILSIIATHNHILLTTAEKDTSNIDKITHLRDLQGSQNLLEKDIGV